MDNLNELLDLKNRSKYRELKGKLVVYKFTNLINNKTYIGITDWINRRIGDHIRYSKVDNSKNKMYFHRSLLKYGLENFGFEIVEIVESKEELNLKETYWITYYKSNNSEFGYNLTLGGNRNIPNSETLIKKSKSCKTKKKIAQYDLDGSLINTFESVKDASRKLCIPDSDLHRCDKKNWSRNGFMFKKFEEEPLLNIEKYSSKRGNNLKLDSNAGKNKIKCQLIDKITLNIIFEANSITELSEKCGMCTSQLHKIYNNKNHKKWILKKIQ